MLARATVSLHDLRPGDLVEVDAKDAQVKRLIAAGWLVPVKAQRKRKES